MIDSTLAAVSNAVLSALAKKSSHPFVLGVCGAQGSGKSTLAEGLANALEERGIATAVLSLDDIYKTKADRQIMARTIHPLFATRGVPGTHDIHLAEEVLDSLGCRRETALPRFDKAADDRYAESEWPMARADTEVLIFEGWCVGARPQAPAALVDPVNQLEADEDPAGIWRAHVNSALASDYQALFARLDQLVLLAAPSFDVVYRWRTQQEQALRSRVGGGMTDHELEWFIRHYERLTRHILLDMPTYADVVIDLNEDRAPRAVTAR
jgi:D-glycerate 3-kinase